MEWCKISEDLKSSYVDRVRTVNNILRDLNYSWDEIEVFWQECIKEAKSKQELLTKNRTMNKRELKAEIIRLSSHYNNKYWEKFPDTDSVEALSDEQKAYLDQMNDEFADEVINLFTKNEK